MSALSHTHLHRAAAYLAKLPPALAGDGGHRATFAAACRLVEFGLSFEQAAPLLASWNVTHCQPQWTEAQLHHKLADAFKRTSPKPEFMAARNALARASTPAQKPRVNIVGPQSKCLKSNPSASVSAESELLRLIPSLQTGTAKDFAALAALRGLSEAGIALASARGLLRFGRYRCASAWFVLDASRRNACARRMDGSPWFADGPKALNLRGVQGSWPIGIREAKPYRNILLVEGTADLLTAFHFIDAARRVTSHAPVAMLSAAFYIPAETFPMFAGKRVRIYTHDDAAGYTAAARWQAALEPYALAVDCFSFAGMRTRHGEPVKDLNDYARFVSPNENEIHNANLLP